VKIFTLEEAQAVLPVVESLLERAMEAHRAALEIEGELQQLSQRIFLAGGMHIDVRAVNRQRLAHEEQTQRAREIVSEIDSIGVEVKDLEHGLLDFPCKLENEVVLLCWKQGEQRITHWHTVSDGFRGRKLIDERFQRTKPN